MADGKLAEDSEAGRPTFFKIMHSTIIQESRLELPKNFVGKLGRNISDVAVLNVCNGTTWDIEFKKAEGALWFQNGLQDFLEYHSIHAGYFLVFRYDGVSSDGKSQFHVLIFDMTGVEVGHCRTCTNCDEQNNEKPCHEPTDYDRKNSAQTQSVPSGDSVPIIGEEKDGAVLKDINSFKSKNPFFTCTMKRSNMTHKYMLIPSYFTRNYLHLGLRKVKLQTLDGRLWEVRCGLHYATIRIRAGFSAFVNASKLEEGDVCLFELINAKVDPVLKVHVFPASSRLEKP